VLVMVQERKVRQKAGRVKQTAWAQRMADIVSRFSDQRRSVSMVDDSMGYPGDDDDDDSQFGGGGELRGARTTASRSGVQFADDVPDAGGAPSRQPSGRRWSLNSFESLSLH
jgi:hypothetical protein